MAEQRCAPQVEDEAETSFSSRNTTTAFKVLVFSRTEGYRHASIPAGIAALEGLATLSKRSPTPFTVHATEDALVFKSPTLAQYRVVIFLQSSGEFFDNKVQLHALQGFVRAGGGIVAVHCASTGLPSSAYYGRLIGAVFDGHPEPQQGVVVIEDPTHPIVSSVSAFTYTSKVTKQERASASQDVSSDVAGDAVEYQIEWFDEWYNFRQNPRMLDGVHILMSVKESTYQGGIMGEDHPIAWCQEFDGGRSFYTALGHFDEAYTDDLFKTSILNGILWAAQITG
ncbi:hypothetical protein N0V82_002019 [Gnomoniopsis sp. IMI 355080]|nr:hypothetical protein N0V82_002019 [Gnomoniopsis sp. IMI 355080]